MQKSEAQEDGQSLELDTNTETAKKSAHDHNRASQPSHTGQLTPPDEKIIPTVDRPVEKMSRTSPDQTTKVQNESLESSPVPLESMNIDNPEVEPIPIVSKSEIDGNIETPKDALEAPVPERDLEDEMQARIDQFKENMPPEMKEDLFNRILTMSIEPIFHSSSNYRMLRRLGGSSVRPIDGFMFYASHVQVST